MYSFTLSNNIEMPCIGFGILNIKKGKETVNVIANALKAGYRHIDSAEVYCNDEFIGEAIKKSDISREDIFITSKLSNDNRGYKNAIRSFYETLERMDLSYLDLYLIHWPLARGDKENCNKINLETWKALEHLYEQGKVKAIGVSNFLEHHLKPILEQAKIKPMVNQLEIHPGQRQEKIVELCKKNNIQVEAWGALGSGQMLNYPKLVEIANKYNKTVAQICIKWCIQKDIVPLAKTVNTERMKENINVFDFEIMEEDIKEIDNIPYFAGSGLHPDKIDF